MSVFIVLIDSNVEAVKGRLAASYSDYYPHHEIENAFFVRTDDIAESVAVNLGIKGEGENKIEGVAGSVFKMNSSYAGYTKNALWDWLNKDE